MVRDKKPPCPHCGSEALAEVIYGLPPPEVMEAMDEARRQRRQRPYAFAGCIEGSWGEMPVWECTRCGRRFGEGEPRMGIASVS